MKFPISKKKLIILIFIFIAFLFFAALYFSNSSGVVNPKLFNFDLPELEVNNN